jgi:VWFA-related protein
MKSRRIIFVSSLLLPLALYCAVVAAQNNPPQQPKPTSSKDQDTYRIETELVQIDLVVTDKQGKPVQDLNREDFELYEDGRKQTLTHFAAGTAKQPAWWLATEKKQLVKSTSSTEPNAATDAAAADGVSGRYVVLAVDDFHLAAANLIFVKRALTKFITEQMVAGDQIALVTTSGNVGMFQQFTDEREVLERAINRLSVQERNIVDPNSIPYITEHQAELIEFGDQGALELAIADLARREGLSQSGGGSARTDGGNSPPRQSAGGGSRGNQNPPSQSSSPNGPPTQRDAWEYRVRAQARMVMAMSGNYTQATLDTLEAVIRSLRPLVGRKMMVLLSDGFFLSGTGVYTKRFDLRRITDAATRAGVVIYSIDARGLATVTLGGDASEGVELNVALANAQTRIQLSALNARRDGLYALAAETGGTLFYNHNDLNLGLQRVLDANETYYVLAYEPPESRRDGRFHKIEVRIAGRPELKVRTRSGYYSPDETAEKNGKLAEEKQREKLKKLPPEKREQEIKSQQEKLMAVALGALWPLRGIPIETAVDFMEMQGFSGAIFNTHINAANLAFEEHQGRHLSVVDMAGYVFDERGKIAANFNERIDINGKPETMSQIIRLGFNHRRLLELKPGFYQARVVVREAKTGRLGSAFSWLEVPNLNNRQLAMSGIFLTEPGKSALQDLSNTPANQNEIYTPRPALASRRFKSGGDMDFLLFVYNAKADDNTVDLLTQTHLFSGSKLIYASPVVKMAVAPHSDMQRVPYAARVPLKGFLSGLYELRVTVIDRLTKATAYRRVNFTVE